MSTRQIGTRYEEWVCKELQKIGYRILTTNFRSPMGEIDIITIHEDVLVFVEVKARKSKKFGEPYEAVNKSKLQKISKTGDFFRAKIKAVPLPVATRIDVASVIVQENGEVTDFQLLKNVTK